MKRIRIKCEPNSSSDDEDGSRVVKPKHRKKHIPVVKKESSSKSATKRSKQVSNAINEPYHFSDRKEASHVMRYRKTAKPQLVQARLPVGPATSTFLQKAVKESNKSKDIADVDAGHDESVSSAEVERVKRKSRKQAKPGPMSSAKSDLLVSGHVIRRSATTSSLANREYVIQSFADLLVEHPEMTHAPGGNGNNGGKKQPTGVTIDDQLAETPNPQLIDALNKYIDELPKPDYMSILTFGVTKEQIAADLRTHNLCLPLQTAQTESRLLAEAGRHTITMVDGSKKTYDFPACCRGQECTGMTSNLPGFTAETPGVVLTTMMFENEYEEFLRTGVYAAEPRPCVLCLRLAFTDFRINSRPVQNRLHPHDNQSSFQIYRNTCEEPGGYKAMFLHFPSSTRKKEVFFDCMAVYSRPDLFAEQDPSQGGRWVVNQEAMIYYEPEEIKPEVGEPQSHFRERVKRTADLLVGSGTISMASAMHLSKVNNPQDLLIRELGGRSAAAQVLPLTMSIPWRLRNAKSASLVEQELITFMTHPLTTDRCRHLALLVRDINAAHLIVPDGGLLGKHRQLLFQMKEQLYTPYTIPLCLKEHVRECCFWEQLRTSHIPPLLHLINKSSPQPCQTRKLDSMIKRFITKAPASQKDSHRALLRSVVLCALLGNFDYESHDARTFSAFSSSSSDRETCEPRNSINNNNNNKYRVLSERWRHLLRAMDILTPDALTEFILTVQRLVLASMRAAVIWAVSSEPVFERHVKRLCDWDAFVSSAQECMRGIRRIMNSYSPGTVEQLLQLISTHKKMSMKQAMSSGLFPDQGMIASIVEHCTKMHNSTGNHTYRRQRPRLSAFIHTCKRDPNGALVIKEGRMNGTDNTDDIAEDFATAENKGLNHVEPRILQVIDQWVKCYDPNTNDVETVIFPHLHLLGSPRAALDEIIDLCHTYDLQRLGKNSLGQRLGNFDRKFPYTFNLVQAVCRAWSHHSNMFVVRLPLHYTLNQQRAIQNKYGIETSSGKRYIITDRVHFLYCSTCCTVYSILRVPKKESVAIKDVPSFPPADASLAEKNAVVSMSMGTPLQFSGVTPSIAPNSRNRKSASEHHMGYMETPVDCMTGRPYCKINRSNGFKRCSEESLSQVYLLGRLLWMRGWVALCPQEGCGLAFLFRPGLCLYNSRGFACASCTDKIRQKERERIEGLSKISSTCALCSTNLLNSSKESYLYPHGLALCANHHSLEMLEAMHLSQLFPVESVKREMARVVTERSELKRKNIAKVNQRHLQEQRRNNRMRKQKYYY